MTALILAICLTLSGCASWYTARTTVEYSQDGFYYESTKDQHGLDAEIELDARGKPRTVRVKTDKSNTPDAIIKSMAERDAKLFELLGLAVEAAP